MRTVSSIRRIASTAAPSAFSFSPSPTQRAAAIAPYSVTRTNSMARLRSGRAWDCSGISGSDSGGRGFHAFGLSPETPERYEKGADDRDQIAVLEVEVDSVLVAAAGATEDDSVEQDQGRDDDPDDHRDLTRAPAQVVPAGDDVGEYERRDAAGQDEPAHELECLPARVAPVCQRAVGELQLRVRVAVVGDRTSRVRAGTARRVPGQDEQREGEDRDAEEADQLGAVYPLQVEAGALLLLFLLVGIRPPAAAERAEDHPGRGGDDYEQDLRVGDVGLGGLAGGLVHEQDRAAEQRAADQPADRALAGAVVLLAGDVAARDREQREHEVGGLVHAQQPAAERAEGH